MIVRSHSPEFGYELLSALPYAYFLSSIGKLKGTVSAKGTAPLYFFFSNHKEEPRQRAWINNREMIEENIPNFDIHHSEINTHQLKFADYRKQYANDEFKWNKPTLCICNRYNKEWDVGPVNYFDENILDELFQMLKKEYHIIYFAVKLPDALQDNNRNWSMNDIAVFKKHKVQVFQDLVKDSDKWNETMLKVFANCYHYITMNGGYSIMASYFKGTNIIYSRYGTKQTKELDNGAFWRWYPNIANSRTVHVASYDELKSKVKTIYIEKKPTINILVSTSGRPECFNECIRSIEMQTYENINILAICDDESGVRYTRKHKCRLIDVRGMVNTMSEITA